MKDWNHDVFGDIFRRKRKVLGSLEGIQRTLEVRDSYSLRSLEDILKKDLEDTLLQEELLWYQQSRCQWISQLDRNTRYYHSVTTAKRKKITVTKIQTDDDSWCSDFDRIKALARFIYFLNRDAIL